MDLAALAEAGLYDPAHPRAAERAALLAYLAEVGCSLEELLVAQRHGRLFALAGDRQIRPVVGLLSLTEAADRLGAPLALLQRAWRSLGLPAQDPDEPQLTDADLDALGTFLSVREDIGEEIAFGISRALGTAMARITEAESAALRVALQGVIDLSVTDDEVVTARAFSAVAALVPRIGRMLDAVHRQHLEATRTHFERVLWDPEDRTSFSIGVGFADLSGFTRLSRQLALAELSQVLTTFEETSSGVVHDHGGRVVKFLGDAVMFVATDPGVLAGIATDLVRHPLAAHAGIEVRAGLAFGPVLAQDGDYFGSTVNLASRLVAAAHPGQVLADPALAALLGATWSGTPGAPLVLRGFDEPIAPVTLTRA